MTLPAKKIVRGNSVATVEAELLGLLDRVGADRHRGRGRHAEAARELDVLLRASRSVLVAQALDRVLALEAARVDHAHRQEHHVLEVAGERAEDVQQRVDAERRRSPPTSTAAVGCVGSSAPARRPAGPSGRFSSSA